MRHASTTPRRALTVAAALCLGTWATAKLYAYASTVRNEAILERLVSARQQGLVPSQTDGRTTADRPPSEGELLGRIDIPRVGVSAVILEGTGERWLEQATGHVPGTANPGRDGNAAIAGHRDSTFRGLRKLHLGDSIEVTTPSVTRFYVVDAIRIVNPTDTGVLAPAPAPRLTLITCYPFDYIGPAPGRFVVQARAVGSAAGAVVVPPRTQATGDRGSARRLSHATPPPRSSPPHRMSWLRRFFRRDRPASHR
jgi:LPXTG-site transpeptidase (sortase) family protein